MLYPNRLISSSNEIDVGNIVCFKGKGFVFRCLSLLLSIFDPHWAVRNFKPWHTAIIWERTWSGFNVLEAIGKGVSLNYYSTPMLWHNAQIYQWLDEKPDPIKMQEFLAKHLGKAYDIAIYFFTALAIIVRHFWNRPIWKLLDHRFSCWELTQEFTTDMGKSILSRYDVVIISDIVKALEEEYK